MINLIFLNTICSLYILSSRVRVFLIRLTGISIGKATSIRGRCYFDSTKIEIGENCSINHNCQFNVGASKIEIKDNVYIGMNCNFCCIGHKVGESSRRAGENTYKKIRIEDGAWIGTNVTVLPGVLIGKGSVIAAGSVVNNNIEPNCLYGGIPAKKIKNLLE